MQNSRKIVLAVAMTAMLAPSWLSAEVVGAVTALQTNIKKTGVANVKVGTKISLGDKLTSNSTGLGMIVFNDESSAKIGPNSQLTIDEFVYSPGRSSGTIGVRMKSGLVRFYGGQISKSGTMQITTPHIVLGVRGGILDTLVKNGTTEAVLRAGQMFCTVNGRRKTITKPGFSCLSDGTTLRIQAGVSEEMALLDSQDRIAGTGVPGRVGAGLGADSSCINANSDESPRCKSQDGSLPGIGSIAKRRLGIPPTGSGNQQTPINCSIFFASTGTSLAANATAEAVAGINAPTAVVIPPQCL